MGSILRSTEDLLGLTKFTQPLQEGVGDASPSTGPSTTSIFETAPDIVRNTSSFNVVSLPLLSCPVRTWITVSRDSRGGCTNRRHPNLSSRANDDQ
jgi:hypothetical protein